MENKKQGKLQSATGQLAPIALFVAVMLAMAFMLDASYVKQETTKVSFSNWVSVEHIRPGEFHDTQYKHNVVTELGLNWTREALSGLDVATGGHGGTNNWTVIELSTDTMAVGITNRTCNAVVTGNGLDIARAPTVVRRGTGNYTASLTFSVSGTQNGIAKVCLSNNTVSAEANRLFAVALLANTVNVQSGDTLIVNYSVAVE